MESFNKTKWEDLDLSRDEVKSIGQALQKEEFRSLLLDYIKEINDPENIKQYESEITQLENERGVDIKFVHPTPGYVLKTSVDGKSKAFINICTNSNVEKPSSTPDVDGQRHGLCWSIPYCLAPPREDVDKKKNACGVYDVVFHPDTLHLTKNNVAFKKLVDSTALEAVENNFHVALDKINLKFPKMQFKGMKHATVIRKKIKNYQPTEFLDIPNYPYPPVEDLQAKVGSFQRNVELSQSNKDTKYTTPTYVVKYRNTIDMQNYTNDRNSKMTITVPDELIIIIDLPLLKCSTDASIDVTEDFLYLLSESPVKYKLSLKLPYYVDSKKGNAKFDTIKKILTVTLSVKKQKIYSNVDLSREDSGVESDNCCGRSNSVSSGDEDGIEKELSINGSELIKDVCNSKAGVHNTTDQKFLKPDVHYTLPKFICQLLKSTLTFTLDVPNVDPESIKYCFLSNGSGFCLSFMSMGAGFYPINYAMCVLLLLKNKINNDTFTVEVWDNNVIIKVKLGSCDLCLSGYYVGTDESNLEKKILTSSSEPMECKIMEKGRNAAAKFVEEQTAENIFKGTINQQETATELPISKKVSAYDTDEINCVNSQSTKTDSQEKDGCQLLSQINYKENDEANILPEEDKDTSVSESASSFDESGSSPHRQTVKSRTLSESHQGEIMRNRGILKIGRSLSESSVDDYASWSTDKIEKTKKTVRFSEVISKQTFRMNSSILGQRKKNQRKMRNKKRAQERRLSESGGESEGESEIILMKGKDSATKKDMDPWLNDLETSSCDVSDVSEISDISESDDGQKEEAKLFMPCSSKKNHKRRGKKSARKHAATAKLQFMEN